MAGIFGQVAQNAIAGAVAKATAVPAPGKPAPAPAEVAQQAAQAVIQAVSQNEGLTVVPIKPITYSVEAWASLGGALLVLGNAIGAPVHGEIADAIETVTSFVGLPAGLGRVVYVVGVVAVFAVIYVRRRWFTHTVTPQAADRAVAAGRAL
jgi:hypothetical protein